MHVLKRVTPARLGETDDRQGEAKKEKAEAQNTAEMIHRSRELWQQARGSEFLQTLRATPSRPGKEHDENRDQEQSQKPLWRAKTHNVGAA